MSKQLFTNPIRERGGGTFRKTLIALSLFLILLIKDIPVSYAAEPVADFGQPLYLDGDGDYVEVPYSPDLNPTEQFTIEAWAKIEGGQGSKRYVASVKGDSGYYYIIQALDSDQWAFWVGQSGYQWAKINGSDIVLNEWTHLAGTYDGTEIRFYVNSILQGRQSATLDPNNDSKIPFRVGFVDNSNSFNGQIDEVRVWNNVVRSQAQIQANMYETLLSNETGLVASYSFNETTGTTVFDQTGNNHDGQLMGDANRCAPIMGMPTTQVDVGQTYFFTPTGCDQDGHSLTFSITGKPAWASFDTLTGKLTGTPTPADEGTTYPIEISVTDGANMASLAFNLSVGNLRPTASSGTALAFNIAMNNPFNGHLFGADLNVEPLTYRLVSQGNKGTVTLTDANTGTFTYTPNAWEGGVDTFSYQVNDGTLDSEIATVTIKINLPTYSTPQQSRIRS